MELVALVILLALMEYMFFSFKVGMARGKYDIQAPAITGHVYLIATIACT